jgi:esterase/lipase
MRLRFNFKQFLFQLLSLYLILGLILFFFQTNLIYRTNNQNFENCYNLDFTKKINYNGTRFYYKENSNDLIVFYHGNAGSACDRVVIADLFNKNNFSFIIVEYAGYSNDKKTPNQELLFQDVNNVDNYIKNNISYSKLIIGSESIGSAFASYHTSLSNPDKLFLISPFDKLQNVISNKFPFYLFPINILLKDKYNNYDKLSNFSGDLIIFHGSNDKVIPDKLSLDLYNSIDIKNKDYIIKKNKSHNDMYSSELFNEIIEFISN